MDDITLGILGQNCLQLENLDIRKSKEVTHFGIIQLLKSEYSHCASSLREINLSECINVPSFSLIMIVESCTKLSHFYIEETDLWAEILQVMCKKSKTDKMAVSNLKNIYVPLSKMDLKTWPQCLRLFPSLSKLTIRMTTYDHTKSSDMVEFSLDNVSEMNLIGLFASHHLTKLTKLGGSLSKLTLSDVSSTIPLNLISENCPLLRTLNIFRSQACCDMNEEKLFHLGKDFMA